MGVASTTNTEIYTGDGSTLTFSFPAYFFTKDDLYVYIYDTVAGTIARKTRGSDYVVTATANSNGLYPSGGLVDFTGLFGAPSATQKVVITREPLELQNYALLTGGTISSAAIVQQFDYLTLLVQYLNDRSANAVQLPPGFGPAFDPNLPADLATAQAGEALVPVMKADRSGFDSAANWPTATGISGAAASATAAAASAAAAAASATAAATSAAAAATSATAAAGSATAAAASAASVGTPWQEFLTGVFGTNTVFTMSHAPVVAAELMAVLGSTPQEQVVDYTLSGVTVTFPGVDVSAQKLFVKGRY